MKNKKRSPMKYIRFLLFSVMFRRYLTIIILIFIPIYIFTTIIILTIVQNLTYFGIFDLEWPLVTLRPLFLKSLRRERHFDIQFTHFQSTSNLTLYDPKFEIWPQTKNFLLEIILTSHWSFCAIVCKHRCNLWFLIKKSTLNRKSSGKTGSYKSLTYIIKPFDR